MDEIATAVGAKVAENLVAPIARPFGYIRNYKTNFNYLKTVVQELEDERDRVQHSVDEAMRNGEEIERHICSWLDLVKKKTDEASEVIEENQRANMKLFKGLFLNPKKRYQRSRNAVKKANAIVKLHEEGHFRTIPKETRIPSYKGYMVFESRMSTFKNILDALRNPDVNMVGIYGTGGIGKTTLAREVAAHAKNQKLFDAVAFAEVAMEPDIRRIQKGIADMLGLTFSEETVSGRANRLRHRLQQKERVLIVLDDIWDNLNLECVGIPLGNDGEGCKLLLTARILDVLLEMESQNNFEVGILDEGEAWSLYEKKAGVGDHLQALAKDVALACGGLPIAIDSVAVALKNKEECEWKDALRKLTVPSTSNFEGVSAKTYSCIEISYNQLKEKELKSTFLLCCIMKNTHIEDLLAYGMGLGIFEKVEAMKDARNRVNTLLQKLKDSSLLLDINDYRFSLHDVVRNVGASIASRDWNMFRNCTIRELVGKDALKNCLAITLHNINELPKELECPELQFFYMSTTLVDNCRFPDNFFVGMPKLKVLHLVGFDLNSMPNSIGLLVNLRTLNIDCCELRDINFIGEIKQLEILRIRSFCSEIETILEKMRNLTGLRLLDLEDCECLRNIPPNVLSTFTQLEELYLPNITYSHFIRWEVKGGNILDELKHLTLLTALKISILDANVLPKGQLLSNKLERYEITFGSKFTSEFWMLLRETSRRRTVKLSLECSSHSDDVQKFLSELYTEGFPELERLWVVDSPGFQTVVDCLESESCHNHFLFLEWLNLRSLLNLKRIHNHQLRAESFRRLTTLEVYECNKLKNIFSFSTYRALPLLQQVYVSSCDNMEEIFAINNDEGTDQIEFKQLRSLRLESLPKLTSFCSINGNEDMLDTPTQLFNQKVAFLSLEEIEISGMLDCEMIWPNQLCKDSFCNLKSLKVTKCNKLLTIFQSNMLERITRLESLAVGDCDLVEEIFDLQGVDFEKSHSEIETLLRKLVINGLPKLKHIWNKDPQKMFSYQKLSSVEVYDCMSLKYLFPVSIAESLSELEQLDLCRCGVEEIVGDDQGETNIAATFVFPQITSLQLNYLPRLKTFYPRVHTSQWQNLKQLVMHGCDKVELFASELFNFQEINEGQHDSSVQPLFMVEKACPCLEELSLDGKQVTMLCQGRFPESLFDGLKILRVNYDHESIFPFDIIQRCQNLEELSFSESHYKEIFPHVEDQTQTKIKTLYLSYLDDLKYIWKQNSKLDLIIQHLEVLKVDWCHSLINLMPPPTSFQNPSTSFQNLTSLKVEGCDSLINMGTSTVAKSLVQLTEMSISSCKKLTEVIGNHGEVIEDEIIFRKLKSLDLCGLPSLTSFCSWNFTLKFPSLETLTVQRCPNMKIFSQGDLTTEKLQEVEIDYKSVELHLDFDLNTAIQQSYEKANSAKDNGASSSHHFEIDQESIQQSYKEAKQSHEEAAFPCLEVDDSYASEDGELSRTDVPITSLSSPPETSKISNEDSSTKQEGASEIHLKTTESSFSRTDVPITSLSSPPETSKISNEDSSTKQEGASEIPLKMTESSFSRIDVPITSLSSPPETSKISNEDSSTKQEGASEIPLKMTESSSDTDDPINIRYSQISSLESLKVSEISQLLKLPPRLHTLKIVGCDALKSLPEELKLNNIHLQQLYIIDCCVLESFSVDHLPTTLKSLYIRNCRKLKFPSTSETKQHALLEHLCIGSSCDSLSSFHLTLFPELRSLAIWDCVNFSSISISKNHMSLDALEIRDCPKLLSFLEEELHTPNLTSIFLSNCKNLKEIPEPMDKLISLRSFFINGCPELSSIRDGCFPKNLSSLCITYCHKLTPSIEWKMHGLNNLSCFEIEGGCINLKSFPKRYLLPSSLNSLRISRLSNLESLDYKGLECLASLETLKINGCDKLQSFPEEGLPSSVTYLYINECPLLKAKFQNRRGEEWYKIAHVTHIQIDEEVIS